MLLSTLILGTILLSITIAGFDALFYEREANRAHEQKAQAMALASGCMEYAMQRLGQVASYQGNESYVVDGQTCTIFPIETGTGWTLKTAVTVEEHTARLQVVLSSRSPVTISSWQEGVLF